MKESIIIILIVLSFIAVLGFKKSYTCKDFNTQTEALVYLEKGFTNLDRNGDGRPCQHLPK